MGFWEWLTLVTFLMALVALTSPFQMLWGRPQITFETRTSLGQVTILFLTIHNKPVPASILIKLGVRRDPATITAAIQIRNEATGKFLMGPTTATDPGGDELLRDVDLPPGVFGRDALVIRAIEREAIAY